MQNERQPDETHNRRILAHMRRAPAGHYTVDQLARNTRLSLAEVEACLTWLEAAGVVRRSTITISRAFHLVENQPPVDRPAREEKEAAPVPRMTEREAADRRGASRANWQTN